MSLTDDDYAERAKLLGWKNPPRVVILNDASDLDPFGAHYVFYCTDGDRNKVLDEMLKVHGMASVGLFAVDEVKCNFPLFMGPPLPLQKPEIIKDYSSRFNINPDSVLKDEDIRMASFAYGFKMPRALDSDKRAGEGKPLNSPSYGEEQHGSKMFVLVTPQTKELGDSGSSSIGALAPVMVFWLDSGAFHHVVGDERILSNPCALPAGKAVTVADGSRLLVTKVGDIQTPHIQIEDVYYVPGLQLNLISVRQLAKKKIITTFYEDHAELNLGGVQIGGAVVDEAECLYRLSYLLAA